MCCCIASVFPVGKADPGLLMIFRLGKEKVPIHPDNQQNPGQSYNQFAKHQTSSLSSIFALRNRRELETTDTELKAMATEAIIGLSRMPKKG